MEGKEEWGCEEEWDDEWDAFYGEPPEELCVICGGRAADYCVECGEPLCLMCSEMNGLYCSVCPGAS